MVSSRKYSQEYFSSFVNLLAKCFKIRSDPSQLVLWKFFHPIYKNKVISYIAIDDKNEVISQYTNTPVALNTYGQTVPALRCLDMATDKNYRGQGFISRLSKQVYSEVAKKEYICSIGFSNDAGIKVDKYASSYGYRIVGKMERYITYAMLVRKTKYNLVAVNNFSHQVQQPEKFISIAKSFEYLHWRYIEKPDNGYTIYELYDNKTFQGYVILKFMSSKCFVIDIITADVTVENIREIVKVVEQEAIKEKKKIIVYFVLENIFWKQVFKGKLYMKQRYTKRNYYLTVKQHKDLSEVNFFGKNNWFIVSGDVL